MHNCTYIMNIFINLWSILFDNFSCCWMGMGNVAKNRNEKCNWIFGNDYPNTYNSRLKNFSLQFKWARFEKWSDFTLLSEPFVRRFALAIVLLALYSSSQMYFWCVFVYVFSSFLTITLLSWQFLRRLLVLTFSSKNAAFCKGSLSPPKWMHFRKISLQFFLL